MRLLRGIGKWLWRFMVIFSFIINLVLIVVLLLAGLFIFQIKNQVADPLIGGLHSTAAGLGEATIDWTIPVRVPDLPVNLSVPINAGTITSQVTEINGQPVERIPGETLVTLTRAVPITINNAFIQSNDLTLRNATVNITLPAGTRLPVALDMEVAVVSTIPVELDVRAVIPLSETQLADPIRTLGLLFEPLAIGLHNLPDDFNEAGQFVSAVLNRGSTEWGEHLTKLLLDTEGNGFNSEPYVPWRGYSQTAGLHYDMVNIPFPEDNLAQSTGVNVPGGIPALDALIRPDVYDEDGNFISQDFSAQSVDELPAYTWDGSFADYFLQQQSAGASQPVENGSTGTETQSATDEVPPASVGGRDVSPTTEPVSSDILPTPSP